MATERQIVANRENSKKSTGPRTAEGKAISSGNAIKHGLTAAKRVVIRDEPVEQFERMHEALQAETVTGSELERGLIDEIAAAMWRLRRAARIERDMMDEDIRKALQSERFDQRACERSIAELIERGDTDMAEFVRTGRPDPDDPLDEKVLLGEQVRERMIKDDGYAKLGRYEVQLRRGLYQAVRELRMLRTQYAKDLGESLRRRPAAASDERPAATSEAEAPNDKSFGSDKAPEKTVANAKDREKPSEKASKKASKKTPAPDKDRDKAAKPAHQPRRGRAGRIVQSRADGATSEMCLPDGSVVRIS